MESYRNILTLSERYNKVKQFNGSDGTLGILLMKFQGEQEMFGKMDHMVEYYTSGSKMKDFGAYFELELNEIGAYCLAATKVIRVGYTIEHILQAKNNKKVYLPYFTYKTTLESAKMSNNG